MFTFPLSNYFIKTNEFIYPDPLIICDVDLELNRTHRTS